MPFYVLENTKELIVKFEARYEAQLKLKHTQGRPVSQPGSQVTVVSDTLNL